MDVALASPWVRLGVPVFGILLSVLARGLSKQYKPLIVREDFFVGPQLIVTSILLSAILAMERHRTQDVDGLFQFGSASFAMLVLLFAVSFSIRLYGWKTKTKLNLFGVVLPLAVGTSMLLFVGMLLA